MSRQTVAHAKDRTREVTLQQHDSDSPLLPIAQMERLHGFRPDLVDWVINETREEALHRRKLNLQTNRFIFTERVLGQAFAFLLGISGFFIGGYVALNGQPWAGVTLASIVVGGLAIAFLGGKKQDAQDQDR